MKNNKKNTYLLILGVIGALIITLGITYAYWRLTREQTGVNVVNTDCFSIDFIGENDITLNKTFPLNDTELENFLANETPYHFTITNHCSSLASATINLESLNANTDKQLADEWIDAILYETDYHKKLNKSFKLTGNPNNDENKVIADALHAYSLKNFTLKANEVKDYYLLLYVDQETPLGNDTQNATWKGKITLSTEYKVDQFANSGTLRETSEFDTKGMWNYREKLTKIVIEPKKSKKEANECQTLYGPFNEGIRGNTDAIVSYVVCEAEDTNCIGYLQGDGGIKLNSDSYFLFHDFKNVTEIEGMEYLDASNVTSMFGTFYGMSSLKELDLSNFDTSSVTDMKQLFENMSNLQTLTLGDNFDTSNVADMNNMFSWMYNIQNITFGNKFITSDVKYMNRMFFGDKKLQFLDLSHFDTHNVTDMNMMFDEMSTIQELDLSSFETSRVEDMTMMFAEMSQLQKLNLSSFDTRNVKNMQMMFWHTSNLPTLDLSSFDTSNVTDMNMMFYEMSNLETLTFGKKFITSQVENMNGMFDGMSNIQELDLSSFDTRNVTDMNFMFNLDEKLTKIIYGPNFIHKDGADVSDMFRYCPANRPDATVHSSWEGISFE